MSGPATESEIELAKLAKEAFDAHRYESCLSTLNKLQDSRKQDGRVGHNRAVAQYMLSNLTLTDGFRKALQTVNYQFDRDAEVSGVDVSVSDKAILILNQALIHLRLHQYKQTVTLLEQLYECHDLLNQSLAIQAILLLVEVNIRMYQLDSASLYMELLETHYFSASQGGNDEEKAATDTSIGWYRSKIHLFRAHLSVLNGNIKACKKEIKSLTSMSGNTPAAQFLKANVEFLRGNYQKAVKVLSSTPKSPMVTGAGECLTAFSFNNLGCIHYQLGKYNLAAHYFRKAIEENDAALNGFPPLDKATPLSGRPLAVLGVNCRHILLYNLGIQQLFSGHPLAAFDSLLEVVQVYHANPRLWLRLAESSISAYTKSVHEQGMGTLKKSDMVQLVFGSGLHRKLIVSPLQQQVKKGSFDVHSQSAAMPAPTLEFAAICLRNSLFLVSSVDEATPICSTLPGPPIEEDEITALRCTILSYLTYVSLGLGDPISALSYANQLLSSPSLPKGLEFLGHVYTAEALVHLGRVSEALQHLVSETVTDIRTTFGPTGQQSEYGGGSRPDTRPSCSVSGNCDNGFPSTPTQARAIMLHNLAAAFCLSGEIDKARSALHQAITLCKQVPSQMALLLAYVELSSGNTTLALDMIKKSSPFPRPTGNKKVTYLFSKR